MLERLMSVSNIKALANLGDDPSADIPKSLLLKIERKDASLNLPQRLEDMALERTYGRAYSSRIAAKLGFAVADVGGSYEKMVYVHEYMKYVELHDEDERALYGIAIRWITEFSKLDAEAQTLSLPFITASAEMGQINAWSRFEVVGISAQQITKNLPSSNALRLDMESYIRLQDAFDKIKGLIWDEGNSLHPQVLAIFGEIGDYGDDDYREALAIGWALTQIRKGKSHGETLKEYNEGSTRFNEIVRGIYANLLGADRVENKPTNKVKQRAKEIVLGFEVKR